MEKYSLFFVEIRNSGVATGAEAHATALLDRTTVPESFFDLLHVYVHLNVIDGAFEVAGELAVIHHFLELIG